MLILVASEKLGLNLNWFTLYHHRAEQPSLSFVSEGAVSLCWLCSRFIVANHVSAKWGLHWYYLWFMLWSWQGPTGAQKLVVPQAGTRKPLLHAHAVQGSDETRDIGNSGERSRLEGDCYVLCSISCHHLFQREVLESHWCSPTPLEVESFFIYYDNKNHLLHGQQK